MMPLRTLALEPVGATATTAPPAVKSAAAQTQTRVAEMAHFATQAAVATAGGTPTGGGSRVAELEHFAAEAKGGMPGMVAEGSASTGAAKPPPVHSKSFRRPFNSSSERVREQ